MIGSSGGGLGGRCCGDRRGGRDRLRRRGPLDVQSGPGGECRGRRVPAGTAAGCLAPGCLWSGCSTSVIRRPSILLSRSILLTMNSSLLILVKMSRPKIQVGHLAAFELKRELNLVALLEELAGMIDLDHQIVLADLDGLELQFLELSGRGAGRDLSTFFCCW